MGFVRRRTIARKFDSGAGFAAPFADQVARSGRIFRAKPTSYKRLVVAARRRCTRTLARFALCGIFARRCAEPATRRGSNRLNCTRAHMSSSPINPPELSSNDSDMLLVHRTVAGDQKAYGLLVIKYQRRIQRLIGRMVRDVDLVEDISQETFIRAYRALAQFRGDAQFYTWLYRIAVNTAKKMLLDMKRDPTISEAAFRGSSEDDDETSRLDNELIAPETPETTYAAKEIAETVNAAMQALPEELRQAVTLREIEGLSYEEIAVAMNCPIGTVRSRIFRAREAISARVKPMLENQSGKRW